MLPTIWPARRAQIAKNEWRREFALRFLCPRSFTSPRSTASGCVDRRARFFEREFGDYSVSLENRSTRTLSPRRHWSLFTTAQFARLSRLRISFCASVGRYCRLPERPRALHRPSQLQPPVPTRRAESDARAPAPLPCLDGGRTSGKSILPAVCRSLSRSRSHGSRPSPQRPGPHTDHKGKRRGEDIVCSSTFLCFREANTRSFETTRVLTALRPPGDH